MIFENWSGGPVDLFYFFLNHNINLPNLIFNKSYNLGSRLNLYWYECHVEMVDWNVHKNIMRSCQQLRMQMNVDANDWQLKEILDSVFFSVPHFFFICVKIDPPDDQNQDIFFLAWTVCLSILHIWIDSLKRYSHLICDKKFMFDIRVDYWWHWYQYLKSEQLWHKNQWIRRKSNIIMICVLTQMFTNNHRLLRNSPSWRQF